MAPRRRKERSVQPTEEARNDRSLQTQGPSTSIEPQGPSSNTATTEDNSSKRVRGPTRGYGLSKINAAAKKKVQIEIDVNQGRPVSPNQSAKLSNQLGLIARTILPTPTRWTKEFEKENMTISYDRLDQTLDVENIQDQEVQQKINKLLQLRTKDQRHRLKKYFNRFSNVEEAKRKKPTDGNITQENWEALCNYWCLPKTKEVAAKNALNRMKNNTPHNQGSRAFVAIRHELSKNELNGEECDRMMLYKKTYFDVKNNRWTTDEAESKYNRMMELLQEAEAEGNSRTIDNICEEVLGCKPGYIPGLGHGPKPRGKTVSMAENQMLQDALNLSEFRNAMLESELQSMRKTLNAHTELLRRLMPMGSTGSSYSVSQRGEHL